MVMVEEAAIVLQGDISCSYALHHIISKLVQHRFCIFRAAWTHAGNALVGALRPFEGRIESRQCGRIEWNDRFASWMSGT